VTDQIYGWSKFSFFHLSVYLYFNKMVQSTVEISFGITLILTTFDPAKTTGYGSIG